MTDNYRITDDSLKWLSLEALKFYYESLQLRFSDSAQMAKSLTERAYKLISIYISLITLECGYLYSQWSTSEGLLPIIIMAIGTAFALGFMLVVITPEHYTPQGRTFDELNPNGYAAAFEDFPESETQQKYILRDEIQVISDSIERQDLCERKRTNYFRLSLTAVSIGLLAAALVFLSCLVYPL